MSKIILGFTGLIASGKDASKKYLEEKYGAPSFRFSTILRDVLNRFGAPVSRDNMITLSTWARATFGQDLLAKVIADDVKKSAEKMIIVDGIRRLPDIEYLSRLPGFYLISIDADPKIRYERAVKRNENPGDAEKTLADFMADHQRETEITIPEVMAVAQYKLDNNGTFAQLYTQIDKIIADIENK